EQRLPEATGTAHRTTPSLLGFGLLEAVPEAEILAFADPFDRNGDGVSGRPNRTADGRLGRFGRKAQFATLREFNAGAFANEMGITSPDEPSQARIRRHPFPAGVDPTPQPQLTRAATGGRTAEKPPGHAADPEVVARRPGRARQVLEGSLARATQCIVAWHSRWNGRREVVRRRANVRLGAWARGLPLPSGARFCDGGTYASSVGFHQLRPRPRL